MIEKDIPDFSAPSDILSEGDLLSREGELVESGYAFAPVKRYVPGAVKRKSRVRERDCYYFGDDKHAVTLTVSRSAHASVATVAVLDFVHLTKAVRRKVAPKSSAQMDSADNDNVSFEHGGICIAFDIEDGRRKLRCECKDIADKKDFECEITLDPYEDDCITTTAAFDKYEFFYGTRMTCFKGVGWYSLGGERVEFSREARGELAWSRGVYPRKCVCYSAGLSTETDGKALGLSLSKIIADADVDENALFYAGKGSKLGKAKFEIAFTLGEPDYLKPWKITDDDGRVGLMFYPMIEAYESTHIGLNATRHKVFGKYYGKVTLDDGTIVDIADTAGYAEHMITRR